MSASPTTPQPAKRKRKSQRVVDSDDEFEQEIQIKFDAEPSPKEATPGKLVVKSKAITRGRKKIVKAPTSLAGNGDTGETGSTTPSVPMDIATEFSKDSELERPAKRPRLPSMRKSLVNSISTTPIGGTTPVAEKSAPLPLASSSATVAQRQMVDGPQTKDIDLRDEDAFSQLFKKSSAGKTETRYDLTSSEKMENKKVELAQLREQYIAQKARDKAQSTPFDIGAQNRKLVDVQHTLEKRGSRVCVNVVGSCILTINRDWIKLAAEKNGNPPP